MRLFIALLALLCASPPLWAEDGVMLDTRPGVKQGFLLLKPAQKPVAAAILFAGGHGNLQLSGTSIGWGKSNFLVRTRQQFADAGLLVAVVDAPSDRQGGNGMLGRFRVSPEHVMDIEAVIRHLKKQANVPVWLVGTSRGTESAAHVAAHTQEPIGGLVLTSSVTETSGKGLAVIAMPLDRITVPTLITAHRADGCSESPPEGAEAIRKLLNKAALVDVRYFEGGDPPRSKPCEALSQHGYLGIEKNVVDAIAEFIKANSR